MTTDTTDLMYAAYLIAVGATVEEIIPCGRYYKLVMTLPEYCGEQAKHKTSRLARLADRSESSEEMPLIYEHSLLKEMSDHYYSLKKKIARLRK